MKSIAAVTTMGLATVSVGPLLVGCSFPPDWSLAGDKTPDWACMAIVYDKPQDPNDPPYMYAIASKLTGNVDAAKILEYSPNQLKALPDDKQVAEPTKTSLSGFDAVRSAGT